MIYTNSKTKKVLEQEQNQPLADLLKKIETTLQGFTHVDYNQLDYPLPLKIKYTNIVRV